MAKRTGRIHKLFISATPLASADFTTGSWTEVKKATNVDIDGSRDEVDADDRSNAGFKSKLSGLADYKVDFTINYDNEDAEFDTIRTAWFSGSDIAVLTLDGANQSGAKGESSNCAVTQFKRGEPVNGVVTVQVTLSATEYTHLADVA